MFTRKSVFQVVSRVVFLVVGLGIALFVYAGTRPTERSFVNCPGKLIWDVGGSVFHLADVPGGKAIHVLDYSHSKPISMTVYALTQDGQYGATEYGSSYYWFSLNELPEAVKPYVVPSVFTKDCQL